MGSLAMKPRAAWRRTRPTARTRLPPCGRLQWLDEASGGSRTASAWLASVLPCQMCHTCQTLIADRGELWLHRADTGNGRAWAGAAILRQINDFGGHS